MICPYPIRARRNFWSLLRWFFVIAGCATLSFVAYTVLDARVFEVCENRRLDLEIKQNVLASYIIPDSQRQGIPKDGEVLGRISVKRLGVSVIVMEGLTPKILRRGVGHVPGTALPGEIGNVALAGHRDTFFRPLEGIKLDDEILITTTASTARYRVDSVKVVDLNDVEVLAPATTSTLTLITCYPFYFVGLAPRRFIVHASRIPSDY
jgi:LPXTG-site transpeptidase (sortase) family protein